MSIRTARVKAVGHVEGELCGSYSVVIYLGATCRRLRNFHRCAHPPELGRRSRGPADHPQDGSAPNLDRDGVSAQAAAMERLRYLDLLHIEGKLLSQAAAADLGAEVPTCPGWTVRDVVRHTAEVYEHKIACIQLAGARPDPWPPSWPADLDPVAWFADAHTRLLDILTATNPAAPSWTWWPPNQTAGFWVRRMAQETAVHRADVQSAFGVITPIDVELAVDGIDEVLVMMLAGDWSDDPQPGPPSTVVVAAADRTWPVTMSAEQITVGEVTSDREAAVTGEPSNLLLWLWGRSPDSAIHIAGDPVATRRLRHRLSLATQ